MNRERGFTMAEMAVTLLITGVMAAFAIVAISQMLTVTDKGSEKVAVHHSLQNAVYWMGVDGASAQSAAGGTSLNLSMPDGSSVSYQLSGTDLLRITDEVNQTIATGITVMTAAISGQLITVNITAAPESRWGTGASQTYQIAMRVTGM